MKKLRGKRNVPYGFTLLVLSLLDQAFLLASITGLAKTLMSY